MKYDPSLIETETIIIDGKEVPYQRIPAGMHGPNGAIPYTNYNEDEDEIEITIDTQKDPVTEKEFLEYMEEGIDPDSDEIRTIKEQIEKEHCEELLDVVLEDEIYTEE